MKTIKNQKDEPLVFVEKEESPSQKKPITLFLSQTFTWSFVISIGCFVGMFVLPTTSEQTDFSLAVVILLLLSVVAGWTWNITLGIIAHRLGRRWLVWVGLSIIGSPIAPFIVYTLMLSHIKAARVTQTETVIPAS